MVFEKTSAITCAAPEPYLEVSSVVAVCIDLAISGPNTIEPCEMASFKPKRALIKASEPIFHFMEKSTKPLVNVVLLLAENPKRSVCNLICSIKPAVSLPKSFEFLKNSKLDASFMRIPALNAADATLKFSEKLRPVLFKSLETSDDEYWSALPAPA